MGSLKTVPPSCEGTRRADRRAHPRSQAAGQQMTRDRSPKKMSSMDEGLVAHLAKLDAPLVIAEDVPDIALDEDLVFVCGN